MDSSPSPILPKIKQLVADQDRNGLIAALRQPDSIDLRAQVAWALGELRDLEATESLVRALLEDPEPAVKTSARQALNVLFGSNAELTIQSYRNSKPPDAWLSESFAFGEEDLPPELSETDLSGLVMIAQSEPDLKLRLQAIQVLARTNDMRATDVLASLALWGDSERLRSAAKHALETLYGDDAEAMLDSYRSANDVTDEDGLLEDDEETDEGSLDEELEQEEEEDLDEDLDEDDWDDDVEDELAGEKEDEEADVSEIFPVGPENPPPSPYQMTLDKQPTRPVVEEMGVPWQMVFWILLIVAILVIVLTLLRP